MPGRGTGESERGRAPDGGAGPASDSLEVRRHFEEEAEVYQDSILRLVPHYREQHEVMLGLLPWPSDTPLRALDLGSGTGVLAGLVLAAFPRARVTALDLTPAMLDAARLALAPYVDRVDLRQADFGRDDIGSGYDLVVSGLAIHHLDDAGKRGLYRRVFQALVPTGLFLNREIVKGATPALTALYERLWRRHVAASNGGDEAWFHRYLDEDRPASVEDQLDWLRAEGFAEVACHWRYLNFAIFGGRRPGPEELCES